MNWTILALAGVCVVGILLFVRHQYRLKDRAYLMQEAIRNRDFTFHLSTRGLFFGERAMQQALNQLGETIHQQVAQKEVESWERLTRVLTHEVMNATAPISSISQSLLPRPDVKGTPLEDGIRAICDTSHHLSEFVVNYRKMSELEKPTIREVSLLPLVTDLSRAYPQLSWQVDVPSGTLVRADESMLRQVLMNLIKNAIEAQAQQLTCWVVAPSVDNNLSPLPPTLTLYVGNDGVPVPAEDRSSLFIPFFTTKRSGHGIGLSLSRRMMVQQGGMLDLCDQPLRGCHVVFAVQLEAVVEK